MLIILLRAVSRDAVDKLERMPNLCVSLIIVANIGFRCGRGSATRLQTDGPGDGNSRVPLPDALDNFGPGDGYLFLQAFRPTMRRKVVVYSSVCE